MNYLLVKRLTDIIISLFLFVILIPFMLVVGLTILLSTRSSIIFSQKRPGKNEKIFNLYKFKTMTDEKDAEENLLPDEQRLTSIGKIIRKYSLDEILQFFNVLKGDMSIIGPRPLLVEYLPLYNAEQKKRHNVKPGITGWAQVNGRNAISWQEKFNLDVWYVENISFGLDLKIFFLTIMKIIKRDGINFSNMSELNKFKGN